MDTTTERLERIQVLLLLQSMKGASLKEKSIQLNIVGFSNVEIAEFLQTSPGVVKTLLYESRKASRLGKRK